MFDAHTILDSKILIVDDEPANVKLLDLLLKHAEYSSIRTTTDSREVVAIYQKFQPDLVLLDLNMPHFNGFQVMEELKKIEKGNHIPVMVLTAQADNMNCVRAFDMGALDFLGKPFDFIEVSLRIKNVLKLLSITKLNNKLLNLMTPIADYQEVRDLSKINDPGHSDHLKNESGPKLEFC